MQAPTPEQIRRWIDDATRPGNFFATVGCTLTREIHPATEIPWEIFRGHLLDGRQTRVRRTFATWDLIWEDEAGRSGEPLVSGKWDAEAGEMFVTRGGLCSV